MLLISKPDRIVARDSADQVVREIEKIAVV
jgi:hypothetical protein